MRTYEALYIVSPELEDDGIQTVTQEVDALVTKHEGTIVRSEIWGKRKLAYPVKKQTDGVYVLLRFTALPEFITRLEAHFKLAEPIIRYLVVHFDEHTLRLEADQQQRREEDMRQSASGRPRRPADDDDDPIPVRAAAAARGADESD